MRILLLCSDDSISLGGHKGACVQLRALASSLLRLGHTVSAVFSHTGSDSHYATLVQQGLEVRSLRAPRTVREIDWHLSQTQADLVIERLSPLSPEGALACAEAGVSHLYHVTGPLDVEADPLAGPEHGADMRAAFVEGFTASSGSVTESEAVARWVRSLAPEGHPVRVEPNGAGSELLAAVDREQVTRLEQRLRLSQGEFRIGFLGAFRPWHDFETLVKAAAEVGVEVPTRLLMVGDGPQRNAILRSAWSSHAAVTLVGNAPHHEVAAYLAMCDVIAVPYLSADVYSSPLKLLEAMAAARPVVATSTEPIRRIVTDGSDCLLVAPGDCTAFADALRRLVREPALRGRIGAEARRTIERGFTWELVAGRMLDFVGTLPERPRPARSA